MFCQPLIALIFLTALSLLGFSRTHGAPDDSYNLQRIITYGRDGVTGQNITNVDNMSLLEGTYHANSTRVQFVRTLPLALTITGIIGMLGNSLVILIIIVAPQMRSKETFLVFTLSLTDLFVSVLVCLMAIKHLKPLTASFWDTAYCRLWHYDYFYWLGQCVSSGNIILLAVERHMAIVYPCWYHCYYTARFALSLYLGMLVYCAFLVTPKFSFLHVVNGICVDTIRSHGMAVNLFVTFLYLLGGSIITVTAAVVFCYSQIFHALRHMINPNRRRALRNTVYTFLYVGVAYILCWSLNQGLFYVEEIQAAIQNRVAHHWHILSGTSIILVSLNNCINPFIYAAQYRRFQKTMKSALRRYGAVKTKTVQLRQSLTEEKLNANPRRRIATKTHDSMECTAAENLANKSDVPVCIRADTI